MRCLLTLLAFCLVACSQPPPPIIEPCVGGFSGGGAFDAGPPQIGTTGQPLQVTLATFRGFVCSQNAFSNVLADDVATEVLDPLNQKVEHSHTAPTNDVQSFSTQVLFTPTMPGSYHLTARFEPGRGTAQTDVQVGVDRSDAPSKSLALGAQCDGLEVMQSGLVLCLTPSDQVKVFRELVVVQTFEADDFATAGNVLWTTRAGVIQRRVEVAGAMPLSAPLSFDTRRSDQGTLFALEDVAVVVMRELVLKLTVVAGALVESVRISNPNRFVPFETVPSRGLDALLSINAQTFNSGNVQICTGPLAQPPTCTPSRGVAVLGADATGIWSLDGVGLRHDGFAVDGGSVTRTLQLTGLMKPPIPASHYESTPGFASGNRALVPRLEGGAIVLESYPLADGFTLMPSSASTVRLEHKDGRQLLLTR